MLLVRNLEREICNKIETQMIHNETQPNNGTNDQIQRSAHVKKSMKSSTGNNLMKTTNTGPRHVQTMTFFKRSMDAVQEIDSARERGFWIIVVKRNLKQIRAVGKLHYSQCRQ
jgi:hypothetical protein